MYQDNDPIKNLRLFMADKNINQTQLGTVMNYDPSVISRILGRVIGIPLHFKLAFIQAYGDEVGVQIFGKELIEELENTPEVKTYKVLSYYHKENSR